MKLIQFFLSKIIQTVYGQTVLNKNDYPIYTPQPTFLIDDRYQILPILQVWPAVILLSVFVITFIILAIKDICKLIEKKIFSINNVVYKTMRRILIFSFFVSIACLIIIFGIQVFYEINQTTTEFLKNTVHYFNWGLIGLFFILQVAIYTCVNGLVYLIGSIKNKRFLWIGLSLFFIIPGMVIFLILLPLNTAHSLNKYLSKNNQVQKKVI